MSKPHNVYSDMADIGEVLAARLPMLAMGLTNPTLERRLEAERMVLEKADAAVEGMFSFQKYCFSAMMNVWSAPMVSDHVTGAIDAYLEPGRKTLQANAERLRSKTDI